MLHLNIVLEMVEQLGSGVLRETEHILGFISHALQPVPMAPKSSSQSPAQGRSFAIPDSALTGLRIDDLRIVDRDSDFEEEEDGDEADAGGDDMTFTAVNLLLSVLEGAFSCYSASMKCLKRLTLDRRRP